MFGGLAPFPAGEVYSGWFGASPIFIPLPAGKGAINSCSIVEQVRATAGSLYHDADGHSLQGV